ncbi:PucR family transcriptional regulator [Brevibacterium casei]|uniref:PucR family transcriptional regulator n=1 Tax=Brevibacterium casei TaxID=33889 RepID=UPI00223C1139|nr:PucR family transcriptional regulator [Brevibacterium casei]MCT2182791.1 PucR family transcriptional regulator [Brevibacterium casei]
MRILDLISDPLLRLELATPSSQESLHTAISSAVATESIDPAAYLSAGTLVLTTGMALNFDDPRIWDGYVERLKSVGTAALAFGEGKPHSKVPKGLYDAANAHDFPILVVPSEVPFLHLQNLVLRALAEEEYQAAHQAWSIAEECTRFASEGIEFAPLLEHVASRVGCVLRVVDDEGAVFTGTDRLPWSQHTVREGAAEPQLALPLNIGEDEQWHLHCVLDTESEDGSTPGSATASYSRSSLRIALTPAAAVLGMVLARSLSAGFRRSEKSDALLAALRQTDRRAPEEIAAALESLGVADPAGIRMLSIRARSPIRLHLLSWRLMRVLSEHVVVFPVETGEAMLLLLVPFDNVRWSDHRSSGTLPDRPSFTDRPARHRTTPADRPGDETYLEEIEQVVNAAAGDGVLIGEPAAGASALSLFTGLCADANARHLAQEEVRTGIASSPAGPTGVKYVGPPTLRDLGALIPPAYAGAIAEALLRPILGRANANTLLESLAAFVESPSVAQAAERLGVHRNTARAHRNELEDALGIDLSSGEDRSMCAVALALMN